MNRSMRFIAVALIALSSILAPKNAKACHFGAAEMWVDYVGAGIDGCTGTAEYKYDVTVIIYYACQTCWTSGSTSIPIQVTSATLGYNTSYTADTIPGPVDTVQSLCPQYFPLNSCANPANVGKYNAYQGRHYKTTIILPSAQPDWIFSTASCCRNAAVNATPQYGSFYIEAGLNNQIHYNNSTPRFLTHPLPYICVNQANTYLNSPFDPQGDSMNIVQARPIQTGPGAYTYLNYNAPYSLADPMNSASSNPYVLNPVTGAATFTPQLVNTYALAFRADEYDRATGIRTAWAMRDVQVLVTPCTIPPPDIDSLKPTMTVEAGTVVPVQGGGKAVVTCPGNNLKFSLNSHVDSTTHFLYMYANTGLFSGSTFSTIGAGTNNCTGTFTWTPTTADIGEHTLVITSSDSSCQVWQPIVLRNYTVVYIKVMAGLDAGRDIPTCQLNPPKRRLSVRGYGNLILNILWSDVNGGPAQNIDNPNSIAPIVSGPGGTGYVVYSSDLKDMCKSRDTVYLVNDMSNTVDIFPQADKFVMCRPDYLQLDAVPKGAGPITNIPCAASPTYTCDVPDSFVIWGTPTFGTGIPYDTLGTSSPVVSIQHYAGKMQFLIRKDEIREYGLRAGSIRSLGFEMTDNTEPNFDYANFSIYIGCTDSTKLDKSKGFITAGLTQVYTNPGTIKLDNGWHNFQFQNTYNWDTNKHLVIVVCWGNNPTIANPCAGSTGHAGFMKYMPTTYPATLSLVPTVAASTLYLCDSTKSASMLEMTTRPVFTMTFCDAPGLPFVYKWYPGVMLSDSTVKQPLAYVPKTTNYSVVTLGKNGCMIADTLQVIVPEHHFKVFPADTSICFGQTAPLEIKNGVYYQWFEYEDGLYKDSHNSLSCDYCANPVAKPKKSTHYKIMVGDQYFCYDTIDAYIEVRPLPLVNILNKDTVVKYGQSLQLLVNGARVYNWTPVATLNNPNISYPVATPTEPTMYVVSGIGSNGCYAYDTVRVGINYRDNLFIPTAFTPNGDGKNDVFKVANMTFQRIQEFKVFNRWGQEVYNGNKGWDGNWHGVPQEMGDYQYYIRVSYPDGLVESYKGNVTLIR
ncbi:MAG: gliding motility-associated C-terminal domain-containing protein [Bacteroidetes bacterium]|nr:gliding motility-associated C-terminal domain-containing protein [Bacteroidota bacterium]